MSTGSWVRLVGMKVKRRNTAVCLQPPSCGRGGLSFCASVLLFFAALRWALADGLGMLWVTIDWVGVRGSGKDIAGFLSSLQILTQWHWGWDGRAFFDDGALLWMKMSDGSTCREGETPFHKGGTFSNSFSCSYGDLSFVLGGVTSTSTGASCWWFWLYVCISLNRAEGQRHRGRTLTRPPHVTSRATPPVT